MPYENKIALNGLEINISKKIVTVIMKYLRLAEIDTVKTENVIPAFLMLILPMTQTLFFF